MHRNVPRSSAFLCGCLSLLIGATASAQRQPVLPQVKVPHPYYFREMYLPQVTSGPSGAAWSPDGQELIYSMQGTLWRQRVGSTEATQITDTPGGYDYEPDWSPDGRQVVFVRYDGRSMSLRLLDLQSATESALVDNGAVNVDPRWSPDGRRIAFVSTAFEGRWHVYLQELGDGPSVHPPVRLTVDHDSGLPRYYYSRYDHYLSPTWSPDGTALIVISNRDHIWGTGGLWRMPVDSGGQMTLLHDEETNWRTHPDWSRDGHRVVYASYLGRQWHQLWLMTDDRQQPVPAHLRRMGRRQSPLVAGRGPDRIHRQRGGQYLAPDRHGARGAPGAGAGDDTPVPRSPGHPAADRAGRGHRPASSGQDLGLVPGRKELGAGQRHAPGR